MIRRTALAGAVLLLAAGCGPPITARRVDAQRVHRDLTRNVLTAGEFSQWTANVLYRWDLVERYDDDPAGALAVLHAALIAGRLQPDETAALAELAFHHAGQGGGPPYYFASALYAWAYLFPEDGGAGPDRADPRVRLCYDLYNVGVANAFQSKGGRVDLRSGTFPLPFGALDVTLAPDALRWRDYEFGDFVSVAELEVEGFPTVYRWPGIGAPLAAGMMPIDPEATRDIVAPRARVPVTVVLRPAALDEQLRTGRVQAAIEVHPGYGDQSVTIGGRTVPLETKPTAVLGFGLADSPIWKTETSGFLRGFGIVDEKIRLAGLRPYTPGLVPVVLVHGTASSAGRWAQLYNALDNDSRIRRRYQFWFFSYETGNPIAYSSMLLRESLASAVARLDPEGREPALRRMVVIGHSQGGLLTKAMVVEPGTRFWENVSDTPLEQLGMRGETADLLRRALLFHPLPFVERVIFVATPHHGSYVAGSWIAHQVARLVKAPLDLTKAVADFTVGGAEGRAVTKLRGRIPTSVDNMTPGNPSVKTLADLPVVPGVHAHSIIAVQGDGPLEKGADGVVAYESAHIAGVDSELVVKSGHSCQANSHTIEEVRRILLLHLDGAAPSPAR